MYIYVPDPHPGRCRNYRFIDGQNERCLDYDNVPHVCSFNEPHPTGYSWTDTKVSMGYKRPEPKPWVKPGDEPNDGE